MSQFNPRPNPLQGYNVAPERTMAPGSIGGPGPARQPNFGDMQAANDSQKIANMLFATGDILTKAVNSIERTNDAVEDQEYADWLAGLNKAREEGADPIALYETAKSSSYQPPRRLAGQYQRELANLSGKSRALYDLEWMEGAKSEYATKAKSGLSLSERYTFWEQKLSVAPESQQMAIQEEMNRINITMGEQVKSDQDLLITGEINENMSKFQVNPANRESAGEYYIPDELTSENDIAEYILAQEGMDYIAPTYDENGDPDVTFMEGWTDSYKKRYRAALKTAQGLASNRREILGNAERTIGNLKVTELGKSSGFDDTTITSVSRNNAMTVPQAARATQMGNNLLTGVDGMLTDLTDESQAELAARAESLFDLDDATRLALGLSDDDAYATWQMTHRQAVKNKLQNRAVAAVNQRARDAQSLGQDADTWRDSEGLRISDNIMRERRLAGKQGNAGLEFDAQGYPYIRDGEDIITGADEVNAWLKGNLSKTGYDMAMTQLAQVQKDYVTLRSNVVAEEGKKTSAQRDTDAINNGGVGSGEGASQNHYKNDPTVVYVRGVLDGTSELDTDSDEYRRLNEAYQESTGLTEDLVLPGADDNGNTTAENVRSRMFLLQTLGGIYRSKPNASLPAGLKQRMTVLLRDAEAGNQFAAMEAAALYQSVGETKQNEFELSDVQGLVLDQINSNQYAASKNELLDPRSMEYSKLLEAYQNADRTLAEQTIDDSTTALNKAFTGTTASFNKGQLEAIAALTTTLNSEYDLDLRESFSVKNSEKSSETVARLGAVFGDKNNARRAIQTIQLLMASSDELTAMQAATIVVGGMKKTGFRIADIGDKTGADVRSFTDPHQHTSTAADSEGLRHDLNTWMKNGGSPETFTTLPEDQWEWDINRLKYPDLMEYVRIGDIAPDKRTEKDQQIWEGLKDIAVTNQVDIQYSTAAIQFAKAIGASEEEAVSVSRGDITPAELLRSRVIAQVIQDRIDQKTNAEGRSLTDAEADAIKAKTQQDFPSADQWEFDFIKGNELMQQNTLSSKDGGLVFKFSFPGMKELNIQANRYFAGPDGNSPALVFSGSRMTVKHPKKTTGGGDDRFKKLWFGSMAADTRK